MKIDSQNIEDGTYEVQIESFNNLSSVKSSLKNDYITLIVTVAPKFTEQLSI